MGVQQVLAANRMGAQQMGQRLAGQVQQQGQAAQQAIQGAQQTFAAKVAGGTATYAPAQAPMPAPNAAGAGDFTEVALMRQGAAAAGGKAGATYTGPKDWAEAGVDVAGVTSQAAKAQDDARALGSMGGRAALLRRGASGPYNSGMASLDAYLSGQGMGAEGAQASSAFSNLSQLLAEARGGSGKLVDQAVATTKDAAGRYGADAARITGEADRLEQGIAAANRRAEYNQRNPNAAPYQRQQDQQRAMEDEMLRARLGPDATPEMIERYREELRRGGR